MKVGIFDIETTGLYADDGIVLCMAHKLYTAPADQVRVIRADEYKTWKNNKSNNELVIRDIIEALKEYDILVAHNGQYFDKRFLVTACLKYNLDASLVNTKIIDPCLISRNKLRLHSNKLSALIAFLGIEQSKTPVAFEHWVKAGLDGNRDSMDYIVQHCIIDVVVLEEVYNRLRKLVKRIDDGGSAW